jgi:hypothetical protein
MCPGDETFCGAPVPHASPLMLVHLCRVSHYFKKALTNLFSPFDLALVSFQSIVALFQFDFHSILSVQFLFATIQNKSNKISINPIKILLSY